MPITDDDFRALVNLIDDGELDHYMPELIVAIQDRNERRKHEILRLVESVWGQGASVVGGKNPLAAVAPSPEAQNSPAPKGYYRAQDGQFYPLPEPELPPATPDPMAGPSKPGSWPTPIESMGGTGGTGVSPVRDPMSSGKDLGDDDPDIVSTGAQIQRYGSSG